MMEGTYEEGFLDAVKEVSDLIDEQFRSGEHDSVIVSAVNHHVEFMKVRNFEQEAK